MLSAHLSFSFCSLGLMKVVALTVEHQNSADKEGQQHTCLFSDWSYSNSEMLLLKKDDHLDLLVSSKLG